MSSASLRDEYELFILPLLDWTVFFVKCGSCPGGVHLSLASVGVSLDRLDVIRYDFTASLLPE